jgi:hypothetical protein
MVGYPINYGDDVSDRKMLSDYIVDLSGYIVSSAVDAVKNERLQRHLVSGNRKINYQFKLVNQIFNFMNRKIHRTYEITKVISECGVIRKITIGFVTFVFGLGLSFGSLRPVASILQPQPQIERQSQNSISNQPYQAMEGSMSPSVRNLLKLAGGDLGKNINPGSRARSDARQAFTTRAKGPKPAQSKPRGSGFAEAWSSNHSNRSRPSAANRLAQQFQTGPAEGGNGLFGRFSARPTPDPHNPGCAGGPRSITVLSGQRNSDSSTELTAYDGFEAKLTDKSENHLTSKHGHKFGVDDPLPHNPNSKPTKYEQTRTRLNQANKAKVREEIESILSNTNSDIYTDVSIRGIQGRVYHCKDTNRVIGIHTEGEFAGQIMKAQPISDPQLDLLRESNILD